MKEFFKPIKTDKILRRAFIISVGTIILMVVYVTIRLFSLPPYIPIFNQLPWGNDRVGPNFTIFIPVFLTILILAINLIISSLVYVKTPLMSRIFSITTLLVILLILIFSVVIVNLVA